ncbi:hypothetical protein [Rhodopirellula europaea]|uniref:PBS lyase HEAT domain protein repeat-containing protein n=1 Tax=Rhodopirellula europaea 6C TaxID=1263867 RepID=M2AE01_9BACT|nr:hypothetical protein [Rhodopirellula europaea]EMB15350.1 hypothetical protein RE6C_03936 [Rhodopirellula europaea 6C]
MDTELFASRLASDDRRSQWWAAVQLMNAGPEASVHLPRLLDICDGIDLDADLSTHKHWITFYAARASGRIVQAIGYDGEIDLHKRVFGWIARLASHQNIERAIGGIWGLADLGAPPSATVEMLVDFVLTDARRDPTGKHTARSVAFRMLARIDRELAIHYADSEACREFLADVRRWSGADPERAASPNGIFTEAGWLLTEIGEQ